MFDNIKNWYQWGFWSADMVNQAVPTLITKEQAKEILKQN